MDTREKVDIDALAALIVGFFPKLQSLEKRVSLELYRLLAAGQPVPRSSLAERVGAPIETINHLLENWPGVYSDSKGRVVGYWGLAIGEAMTSQQTLTVDGQSLSAWCAWDTLFLPQLLGKNATIEATSPPPGGTVTLTVTPDRVEKVVPADACMSFLLPDAAAMRKDIPTALCHSVYFFTARQNAESWIQRHKGTFLLSMEESYALARRKNELQYGEALA
jgi:alkylmercury lyase